MKKIISILLCVMMLVGSLTIASALELPTIEFGNSDGSTSEYVYDKQSTPWVQDTNYVIKSGCTFVIKAGAILNVPYGSSLTVEKGAHLVANGQLNAIDKVVIEGKLSGNNITGQDNISCAVEFPSLADPLVNLDGKIAVKYYVDEDYYGDVGDPEEEEAPEVHPLDKYKPIAATGETIYVPYGYYLFVNIHINEAIDKNGKEEDRYDDKLFTVLCNNVILPFEQNACPTQVKSGSEISYGSWVSDSTYYNTYTITLPEGEGYTVVGRRGEMGEVTLKYGNSFSFRVELEEDYNQSPYEVYVYDGYGWTDLDKESILAGITPAVPDAEGYYSISNIKGDYSIFVEGVVSNDMLDIMQTIFNIFKQIFEAITSIFNQLFGGTGDILGGLV